MYGDATAHPSKDVDIIINHTGDVTNSRFGDITFALHPFILARLEVKDVHIAIDRLARGDLAMQSVSRTLAAKHIIYSPAVDVHFVTDEGDRVGRAGQLGLDFGPLKYS